MHMHMQSKGTVVAGFGLGALLIAVGACGQGSRSETASKNGNATQHDNGSPANAQVLACTDVTGNQLSSLLTTDAPTMNGYFLPHGAMPPAPMPTTDVAPTCDDPLAMPPVAPGSDFHYRSYTFANDGDAAACVSVRFDLGFIKSGPRIEYLSGVETLAYLDSFDPTNIQKNYLAGYFGLQGGNGEPAPNNANFCCNAAAGIQAVFSFKVPAHAKFVVVVSGKESPREDVPPDQSVLYFPYNLHVTNCRGQSDAGLNATDAGPSDTDAGPSGTDAGPSGTDAGPSGTDAGPSGTDAGPSGTDAGTSGGTGTTW